MTGFYADSRRHLRAKTLEKCACMVNCFMSQLEFHQTQTDKAVEELSLFSELGQLGFLSECVRMCSAGTPFPVAWDMSVEESAFRLNTGKDGVMLLKSFGEQLGTTDLEGQQSLCALYKQRFESAANEAEESNKKNAGLYPALGIIGGLLTAVLYL